MSAGRPFVTADAAKKVSEKAKKQLENTPQYSAARHKQIVHSGWQDHLSGKVPPYYTNYWIDFITQAALLLSAFQSVCFNEQGTDEKYEYVNPFLLAFLL